MMPRLFIISCLTYHSMFYAKFRETTEHANYRKQFKQVQAIAPVQKRLNHK